MNNIEEIKEQMDEMSKAILIPSDVM